MQVLVVDNPYELVQSLFRVPRAWLKLVGDDDMRVIERFLNPFCWGHARNSTYNAIQVWPGCFVPMGTTQVRLNYSSGL
jgi:hypothetical protein